MINDIDSFISGIESMFSVYKSGMREEIKRHFEDLETYILMKIFDVIKRKWEKEKSPTLANIIRICREEGICIKSQETEIISICEFCYTGTEPITTKNKFSMANYPYLHDKDKWPKKIILIDETTGYQCHCCHNKPILGMCFEKNKNSHIEKEKNKDGQNNYDFI